MRQRPGVARDGGAGSRALGLDREAQELLARAFRFAARAHAGQTRKGSDVPYLSHPIQVSGLVLAHGGTAELAAVGLLHDTLEDCAGVTAAILEEHFGAAISERVGLLTDLLEGDTPEKKSRWLDRKRHYLAKVGAADAGTRLVAACDKLDNLRSLVADVQVRGIAAFERFTASPGQTRWYYEEVRHAVGHDLSRPLIGEIDRLLAVLWRTVPEVTPEPDGGR